MKKAISILWVSALAPYNAVKHAGGKTHNYYTKSFGNDQRFDVTLVTWCEKSEEEIIQREFSEVGIKTRIILYPYLPLNKVFWKFVNVETRLNPFNRYAGYTTNSMAIRTLRELKKIKESGYHPDVIFLHWTHINLLSDKIVELFPESKIIEMEVDVAYQGYHRHIELADTFFSKKLWEGRYRKIKKIELQNLMNSDGVIVNNKKDERLLINEGIDKPIFVWSPFFQSMLNVQRNYSLDNRDIIFYGAMDREENWKSALWFIDNVLPALKNVRFIIIGNRPPEILKSRESDVIKVLGFVQDITPYFSQSLCLVAPLVLGAGIKVKILEGLSSGIPVLTNQIGIEGIPAERDSEYFHCESAENYIERINELINNVEILHDIEQKEKEFINMNYNIAEDAKNLHEYILKIAQTSNVEVKENK